MALWTWRHTDADESVKKRRPSLQKMCRNNVRKCPMEDLKSLMYNSNSYDTYD